VTDAQVLIKNNGDNNNEELNTWSLYLYAMKSPVTRQKYQKRLEKFFDFLELEGNTIEEKSISFLQLSKDKDNSWVFNKILLYMQALLDRFNRKEITGSTIRNHVKSIKLYMEIADIPISWKKISRGLPRARNYSDDRIPTIDEIRTLLSYPDRRLKGLIYTMSSSGIRLGAWDYLKWGHIRPIRKDEGVVAAKIIVYAGEEDEYFSFISKQAYDELADWMHFREISGETINEDSWIMRDLWDTQDIQGKGKGLVTKPNKLTSIGIKKLVNRAIWAQGLRKKLENGKKRHPWQAIHCYRKWYKTRCEMGGMKPINIEMLLSHSIGISNSYYRPTESELLEDYLRVCNTLLIDKEVEKTLKELRINEQRNKEEVYLIKGKLEEKEEEIKELREQAKTTQDVVASLSDKLQLLLEGKFKDK
jgi:integrase